MHHRSPEMCNFKLSLWAMFRSGAVRLTQQFLQRTVLAGILFVRAREIKVFARCTDGVQ